MRIGVHNKKQSALKQKKPALKSTPEQDKASLKHVGGNISANLIETIYASKLQEISTSQAEQYAEVLLAHEDSIQADSSVNASDGGDDITEEKDAADPIASTVIPNINAYLFGTIESREEMLTIMSEASSHFTSVGKKAATWKVHANAAKFERHLDEKYGVFRPFITEHPEIEVFIRGVQRKYVRGGYSPFRQGDAPVDKKTSIIILFIMHRNGVKMENLILGATFFLVGLQPLALVLLIVLGRYLLDGRKKKKVAGWLGSEVKVVSSYYADAKDDAAKQDILRRPVGTIISDNDFKAVEPVGEETYDTMVVGSGPDTLYTAALLARTGRTVLVVSPEQDASGCHSIAATGGISGKIRTKYNVPFDVDASNVAHTAKQQRLLAPALCTDSDAQGGIRFSRIGTEADGFTSDILSIPGMGVDNRKDTHPFILRAGGAANIANDTASYLGDGWTDDEGIGNSTSAGYLAGCAAINATASEFYVSKLVQDSAISKKLNMKKNSSYQEASVRYSSGFLDQLLPLNAHVRSLMAGIGMKGENLPPSKTSMAVNVTNTCAQISPEGFSYPVGGPRALCHALASVIEQNGGKVITGVKVKEFVYHEDEETRSQEDSKSSEKDAGVVEVSKPRCHGVQLVDGRIISVGTEDDKCVVSMLGFIPTFIFHMSDTIRSKYGLPSGLPALTERRPLLHFLVGLNGSAADLSLTGADWYRLPNASLALDERDPSTGQVKQGLIGAQVVDYSNDGTDEAKVVEDVKDDDNESASGKRDKRTKGGAVLTKVKRNKFKIGESWMKVSFPSAKDPSWKERHGDVSTCVVTVEADDSFVQQFDCAPKIFSNTKHGRDDYAHLLEKVTKELSNNFPQLKEKIDFISMIGPTRKGLSHTPLRYAAKGIKPETPYPGLFVGGSDLTVGDSFSGAMVGGWMAANAVLKYSFIDHLYLEKNITNDLKQFLKSPQNNGVEDVAVPLPVTDKVDELPQSAESSKEE